MGGSTAAPPSVIWGQPGIAPAIDQPIQQGATFGNNAGAVRLYRSYRDSQILGVETHLVQSLLSGLTGTWVLIDAQSPSVSVGQWVCPAGSPNNTVTLALLAALVVSGAPCGMALTPGAPGTWIRIALQGLVPPAVSGLLAGSNVYAQVNTATAFTSTVATLGSNSYPVGTVDAFGNLNVHINLPPAPGGASLSFTGTGFLPVAGGTPGTARAVNLSLNGVNGDVTGLAPWVNGGRLQGVVNVTHAAPGTLSLTIQIAYCDSSTGTTQVTLPASPTANFQVMVADTGGVAAANPISVVPNGNQIWDPNQGIFTFGGSNVTLAQNGVVGWWQWDANKTHWVDLLTSAGSGGGGGIGVAANVPPGSTITLNQAASQIEVIDSTGARSLITMPQSPNNLDIVRATLVGASNNAGQAFIGNTGQSVGDPDNAGQFKAAGVAAVSFTVGGNLAWFWQALNSRWVRF